MGDCYKCINPATHSEKVMYFFPFEGESTMPLCNECCSRPLICGDCGYTSHCEDCHGCEMPYQEG